MVAYETLNQATIWVLVITVVGAITAAVSEYRKNNT